MSTLFANPSIHINLFKARYDLDISEEFIQCANEQLTPLFIKQTGLKFNKNVCISWEGQNFIYESGQHSRLSFNIFINHNWNSLIINWTSKSGRIYMIDETNIDSADIEFGFENLDPALYYSQLNPENPVSFKIKNLNYDLDVQRINIDCTFRLGLRPEAAVKEESIIQELYAFIEQYNLKSEKMDRKHGVIHNCKACKEDDLLVFEIDLGSTGMHFMKNFLKKLSSLEAFTKVIIE